MYRRIEQINAEGTMLRAERNDGSLVIIEPQSGDLFQIVSSGAMGKVEAFLPPPELPAPPPPPDPVCEVFRIAMAAAKAVADGVTNPSDAEIRKLVDRKAGGKPGA